MVRYTVSYSCGHTGTVNLIGPSRSRESRLSYLASGECFDCFKQHSTAVAHEQAEELELPALVGTEKQVSWAETLRLKQLTAIEAEVEDLAEHALYRQILLAVEQISNETSAKQWIEWRYDLPRRIISDVLESMKATPTQEQKQQQLAEQARADAIKRTALLEVTIRPETPLSELAAELHFHDNTVSVSFPERDETLREVVRALGYGWSDGQWQRTIKKLAGSPVDRAVELGCTLLAHGFIVRVFDESLRAKIVAGAYVPEHTRWIIKIVGGEHIGWLAVQWGRDEDYYNAARKIKGSRYSRPYVIVPPAQFEQIFDFAQVHDFRLSIGAQEALQAAREEKEQTLTVTHIKVPPKEKKPAVGAVPPVLAIPENIEVAGELKDD